MEWKLGEACFFPRDIESGSLLCDSRLSLMMTLWPDTLRDLVASREECFHTCFA